MRDYEFLNAMMACLTDSGTEDQSFFQSCYMCPLQSTHNCIDVLRIEFLKRFIRSVEGDNDAEQDN